MVMDYEILEKIKVEDFENCLKIHDLKVTGTKKGLVYRVFAVSENGFEPINEMVGLESNLISDYKNRLTIYDFPIPDPFKIPHRWMEEDEGMGVWPMLSSQIDLIF